MGQISSAPVELVRVQRRGGAHWRGAVAEMQGWRADHEDAHFSRDGGGGFSLFGVLDGHGGREAARVAARRGLPDLLTAAAAGDAAGLEDRVRGAFEACDARLRAAPEVQRDQSGATCVVAGLAPVPGGYGAFLANAGDSRGLIVRRGGGPLVASDDHKPDRPDELRRIREAGGFVSDAGAAAAGAVAAVARLDGNLAVSRGLGDFAYKRDARRPAAAQKVSCVPELYETGLAGSAPLEAGDLVILACDGVFDVLSSEQLAALVAGALDAGEDPGSLCARVLEMCLRELHSKDNMTLLVVEAGVDGSAYRAPPGPPGPDTATDAAAGADEIVGLDKYERQPDDAVRRAYRAFLEACAQDSALPAAAERLLLRTSGAPRRPGPLAPPPRPEPDAARGAPGKRKAEPRP